MVNVSVTLRTATTHVTLADWSAMGHGRRISRTLCIMNDDSAASRTTHVTVSSTTDARGSGLEHVCVVTCVHTVTI